MKRHILLICAIVAGLCVQAQSNERYEDLINRTESLPAYQAMYNLLAYQRLHPEHAAVYYRLGEAAYTLLPAKDALHDYGERAELLYKARLFYGNCLHFMGGKLPRGEAFPTVTPAGKRLEYTDVETYLRARLDTISRWRAETDTLHDRFYRMVDRYEACRQLFMQFMEKYPSEKLAHLCFTPDDRDALQQLGALNAEFEQQRQLFIQALTASPVPHYAPQFRFVPITAYRLDGLTSSDFLANDIPLWDYKNWTDAFIYVQQHTYLAFMRELVQEFRTLDHGAERFRQGLSVQLEPDKRLPNRIERYDYKSPVATFIRLQQLVAATVLQAQDSLTTAEQITDSDLSLRITANVEAQQRLAEAQTYLRTLQRTADESTARKFAFFLRETGLFTVRQMLTYAEQAVNFQLELTHRIDEQLQDYANRYPKQFEDVDISDDQPAE